MALEGLLAQKSHGEILDQSPAELTEEITRTGIATGSKLDPYTIESVLGQGGMGQVFRAFDPRLGRRVAMKVSQHSSATGSSSRQERFPL